jgi:uncharacterized protein YbaR (Trm112 family)
MNEPTPAEQDEAPIIRQALLDLLVCPLDKSRLDLVQSSLICTKCGRVYPIENGIPNLIVEWEG